MPEFGWVYTEECVRRTIHFADPLDSIPVLILWVSDGSLKPGSNICRQCLINPFDPLAPFDEGTRLAKIVPPLVILSGWRLLHPSEFSDEADTANQQNTAYDATGVQRVWLHPEPAVVIDQE